MRVRRDFDAELRSLEDKARDLRHRKVPQLGELVISTGADAVGADELTGWPKPGISEGGRHGRSAEPPSFRAGRGELHRRLTATGAALRCNRAARNRHQAALARHDMRAWQVERRKRTRHLIELGGLVVKVGIVELSGDDRAMTFGALLLDG